MAEHSNASATGTSFDATKIEKPAPELFTYYLLCAIMTLPAVVIVLPLLWFRYTTLRYKFDEEGVSMRWGILFQQETLLTYRRIQDIHVTRDLFQRWLGLATVSVQTASGSATPEMKIEGVLQAEELRDYLYERMRGAREGVAAASTEEGSVSRSLASASSPNTSNEATQLLREIRDNLAKLVAQRGAS